MNKTYGKWKRWGTYKARNHTFDAYERNAHNKWVHIGSGQQWKRAPAKPRSGGAVMFAQVTLETCFNDLTLLRALHSMYRYTKFHPGIYLKKYQCDP